jgi:glutamyl/glutaminyl-tRNA synthetase
MNKYHRWHDAIIERARAREAQGEKVEGDRHHVVPKSLGGSNDSENLVKLTYREHFLVHWLLIKMMEGRARAKMRHALFRMMNSKKRRGQFTSWQFELGRCAQAIAVSEFMTGRKLSPEQRERIRDEVIRSWTDPEIVAKRFAAINCPDYQARHAAKTSAAFADPEVKVRQSEGLRKAWADPQIRARIIIGMRRVQSNPEINARRSASLKEAQADPEIKAQKAIVSAKGWTNPEIRARRLAGMKRAHADPEVRAAKSARMKQVANRPDIKVQRSAKRVEEWADPEIRARRSAGIKAGWVRRNARLAIEG